MATSQVGLEGLGSLHQIDVICIFQAIGSLIVLYCSLSDEDHGVLNDVQALMDTILGYEIPLPASDVYISILTVMSFLPAVFAVHRLTAFALNLLPKRR
jgi:hypothetical protein